jgi:hypothetical protein
MAKRFNYTIRPYLQLDCEKHLCMRCQYKKHLANFTQCNLFIKELDVTDKGHCRRLNECKISQILGER